MQGLLDILFARFARPTDRLLFRVQAFRSKLLRLVKLLIGELDELPAVFDFRGVARIADAYGKGIVGAGLRQLVMDAIAKRLDRIAVFRLGEHDELVAAEARNEIMRTRACTP